MSVIVTCPSCKGKLRVSDELRGQRVRCPACSHTFDTDPPTMDGPGRDPLNLPLQLSLDEPSSEPRPTPAGGTRGLVGAVELNPSPKDEPAPPPRPSPPTPLPQGERGRGEGRRRPPPPPDADWDLPDFRRFGPRRDAEPDRGAAVLSLGIISLAVVLLWCGPLGAILGLIAWIMGQTDLRKMKRGVMDTNGEGMTRAGWICGIIGTLINGLLTLGCLGMIGMIWYEENNRPIPTFPSTRPAPVQPKWPPPNQKPPGKGF